RLADHSYGQCADCGEAIDIGRLMALAATPCCTACQAIREHRQSASLRWALFQVAGQLWFSQPLARQHRVSGSGHVSQRPRSYRSVGLYQPPV
ncbi:MAG: TraR/DksA C4-type zinc finger protein, partial [Polaromonas sp.]|nr:TraR/DksA C4-type zinc finger protein [Polaromonas sp.]